MGEPTGREPARPHGARTEAGAGHRPPTKTGRDPHRSGKLHPHAGHHAQGQATLSPPEAALNRRRSSKIRGLAEVAPEVEDVIVLLAGSGALGGENRNRRVEAPVATGAGP